MSRWCQNRLDRRTRELRHPFQWRAARFVVQVARRLTALGFAHAAAIGVVGEVGVVGGVVELDETILYVPGVICRQTAGGVFLDQVAGAVVRVIDGSGPGHFAHELIRAVVLVLGNRPAAVAPDAIGSALAQGRVAGEARADTRGDVVFLERADEQGEAGGGLMDLHGRVDQLVRRKTHEVFPVQ